MQRARLAYLSPLLLAAGISLQLVAGYALIPVWQAAAWAAMLYGCVLSQRTPGPRWAIAGLALLIISGYGAALSRWWQHDVLWTTDLMLALWLTPMLGYYIAARDDDRIWQWLIVGGWAMAGAVLYQGTTHWGIRASGLTDSPNPTAEYLVVMAAYALATGHSWAASPLIAVLPLTGSRWPLATILAIAAAIPLVRRDTHTLQWGLPVILALLLAAVLGLAPGSALRSRLAPDEVVQDTTRRLMLAQPPSMRPAGIAATGEGPVHNVPLRIATEWGLPAALAWGGVTGAALWRRPRYNGTWWALVAVVVMDMMDYSLHMGPGAPLWWLLVGTRIRSPSGGVSSCPVASR